MKFSRNKPIINNVFVSPVILFFLCLGIAVPDVFYLNNTASGKNNGLTETDAWQSLSAALSSLNSRSDKGAGHTVIVKDGTGSYGDFNDVTVRSDYLTFQAENKNGPSFSSITLGDNTGHKNIHLRFDGIRIYKSGLMDSNQDAIKLHMAQHVELLNLNITSDGYVFDNDSDAIHMYRSSNVTIRKCEIKPTGSGTQAFDRAICAVKPSDFIVIDDCEVTGCSVAVQAWGRSWTIQNNHFHNLYSDGILGACIADSTIKNNQIHEIEAPVFVVYEGSASYNHSKMSVTALSGSPFGAVQTQDWCRITVGETTSAWKMISIASENSISLRDQFDSAFAGGTITRVECKKKYHCDCLQMWKGWDSNSSDEYMDDFKVENIVICDNQFYDIRGQAYTQCILWNDFGSYQTCSNITFENNLLYNAEGGYEFYLQYTDGIIIRNNTIIGVLYCNYNVSITKMYNNIIQNFGAGNNNVTINNENNNIAQIWTAPTRGSNTKVVNTDSSFGKVFQNLASNNYIIRELGIADNNGNPDDFTSYDLLGQARNSNSPDIGAYELTDTTELPNQAPGAAAGSDIIVWDEDQDGSEQVLLDGSASTDPDGTIISYVWADETGKTLGTGRTCQISLDSGSSYKIILIVTDDEGLTDTDNLFVSVRDIADPQTALVAHWPLNDNEGFKARDNTQNHCTAILRNNPKWTEGQGILFSGNNEYLEVNDGQSLNLTTSRTFSAWIKLSAIEPWKKIIIKPYSSYASPWELYALDLGKTGNCPRFTITNGIPNSTVAIASNDKVLLSLGLWYHLVGTYDKNTISLYLNGNLIASQSVDFQVGINSMPLSLGGRLGNDTMMGYLSDVRIYDGALTMDQIQKLYIHGRNDSLTGHWRFNDYSQTLAMDSSGYQHTASLIGNPACGRSWTAGNEEYIQTTSSNQAVMIPAAAITPEAGTIAFWATPEETAGLQFLVGHVLDSSNRISLLSINGHLAVGLGTESLIEQDIATLSADEPAYIALTWNNGRYNVYINGQLETAGTYSGLSQLNSSFDIGNYGDPSSRTAGFRGIIEDIRTYSRSLSAAEVSRLYQTYDINENQSLTIDVTGADSQISYTPVSLPAGASFDVETQTFFWNPWYNQLGDYTILFDADGQDSKEITISVQETPLQPWYENWLIYNGKL